MNNLTNSREYKKQACPEASTWNELKRVIFKSHSMKNPFYLYAKSNYECFWTVPIHFLLVVKKRRERKAFLSNKVFFFNPFEISLYVYAIAASYSWTRFEYNIPSWKLFNRKSVPIKARYNRVSSSHRIKLSGIRFYRYRNDLPDGNWETFTYYFLLWCWESN